MINKSSFCFKTPESLAGEMGRWQLQKKLLCAAGVALFSCFGAVRVQAQQLPPELKASAGKQTAQSHFVPAVAAKQVFFRDFATSPLFYEGPGLTGSLGWQRQNDKSESLLKTDISFATTSAEIPPSDYYQTATSATFMSAQVYTHYLRKIEGLSSGKLDVAMGGALVGTFNVRLNSALHNNAAGMESLANLMYAAKVTRNISRLTEQKKTYLGFINRTLKPAERYLSFQVNAGLLNLNYRPGYSYKKLSDIDNANFTIRETLFPDHKWKMNGWRLGTRLEYTKLRPSGNGHKWAYVWEAAHAPGRFEAFQMASHSIEYALIINCK